MAAQPSSWQSPVEPAGPAPGVRFAGHGARLGAYILDGILVGVVTTVAVLILAIPLIGMLATLPWSEQDLLEDPATWAQVGPGVALFVLGMILVSVLALLYFPFFWVRGGQTPGMKVAGIRVVNDRDGSSIGWGQALLRLIGYWISGAVFYLGFVWILIDARRRGWHDLIAGTCVIGTR
jgi:uncharacterized RDD family membrane protein YckC